VVERPLASPAPRVGVRGRAADAGRQAATRGGVPRPTARGGAVVGAGLALVVVGAIVPAPALVFAGTTLVVLVLAVLVSLVFRRPRLVATRRFSPDRGMAGWSVDETVTLTATGGTAGTMGVRDDVGWRRTRPSEAVGIALVPGRASSAVFRHDALPRGRHRVGPLHVDLIESFGVARRRVVAPGVAELVVVPEVHELGGGAESRALGDGARRQREHSLAGGDDDPVTRQYRRGDPMRRVHWKASARHDELMVRQEEQHGLPSARLVLATAADGWSDSRRGVDGRSASEAFEWAVSVVASLGVESGRSGSSTQVTTPDGDLLARHDPDSTAAYLEALADLELSDPGRSDPRGGGAGVVAPPPAPREPVVAVVSGLRAAEIEAIGRSRAVGSSAVALVVSPPLGFRDPSSAGGARAHDDLGPDEVAVALRDAGWRVVTATSGDPVVDVVLEAGLLDD
jgi:uncharacterized protein (DUF58 family)